MSIMSQRLRRCNTYYKMYKLWNERLKNKFSVSYRQTYRQTEKVFHKGATAPKKQEATSDRVVCPKLGLPAQTSDIYLYFTMENNCFSFRMVIFFS